MGVVCLEVMHGNYGRLVGMGRDGVAFFYMTATRSRLPFESGYPAFFCVGRVPEYHLGYPLTLYGEWREEAGKWKFLAARFEEDVKSGRVLQDFLLSQCVGVGERTAEKFAAVGEELWDLVYDESGAEALHEKTGVSEALCRAALSILRKKEEKYRAYQYLCIYGISDLKIGRLVEKYGIRTLDMVKANPYGILEASNNPEACSISFQVADEIAFGEGMPHYHKERVKGLVCHALRRLTGDGSTWTGIRKLFHAVQKASMQSVYHKEVPGVMISVALGDIKQIYIDRDSDRVYLKEIWHREWDIARGMARLDRSKVPLGFDEGMVADLERELGITYAKGQREAFAILESTGVKVLTGGPGVGKTTLIDGLVRLYRRLHPDKRIALCAPTGMASEHMAEFVGMPASTIHRLLDYRPFSGGDASYKSSEDPIKADFIIVDETSMADTRLMGMLFDAVPSGALLLLCGDAHQLDSVGCGAVLHDMIASGAVDVFKLDALFRQRRGSRIAINSARILKKDTGLAVGGDFEIFRYKDQKDFIPLIGKIWSRFREDPFSAQILSTTKRGGYGTGALNAFVQGQIDYGEGRTIRRNGCAFHEGDKVMTIANNYQAGYFNGDIGRITEISHLGNVTIQVGERSIRMQRDWMEDMVPAYAVTIHKSQGSEFPYTIIVLPKHPALLLDQSIIYTAVTRAKKKAIILSQEDALECGIRKDKRQYRNTGLIEKIQGTRARSGSSGKASG